MDYLAELVRRGCSDVTMIFIQLPTESGLTQGYFMREKWGDTRTNRDSCTPSQKRLILSAFPILSAPQTLNNELSPAMQVLPAGKGPWDQAICTIIPTRRKCLVGLGVSVSASVDLM